MLGSLDATSSDVSRRLRLLRSESPDWSMGARARGDGLTRAVKSRGTRFHCGQTMQRGQARLPCSPILLSHALRLICLNYWNFNVRIEPAPFRYSYYLRLSCCTIVRPADEHGIGPLKFQFVALKKTWPRYGDCSISLSHVASQMNLSQVLSWL